MYFLRKFVRYPNTNQTMQTSTTFYPQVDRVQITGASRHNFQSILTTEAITFISALHHHFNDRRHQLLADRRKRQAELDQGWQPDFLPETQTIRDSNWKVAPLPPDLLDRRVEITGPVDRKMIINALNSGAKVFMADFEDSNSPNWSNNLEGQVNLFDAIRRTIEFVHPQTGKVYALHKKTATLMVRPRGWHLEEKHFMVDNVPVSGGLFDFGLYFFHNAKELLARGSGPYFYLPKLEDRKEARLWNDVFVFAQDYLGIPQGTIKATVLIETILASFQLDEILYELKDHSAGLNCGRWDYIFSFIKRFRNQEGYMMPDRGEITMTVPFMQAYTHKVIQTCHRRGVHAMGGMAAQIPIKNDPEANQKALDKVRADKTREVQAGHDGTWVAHPALVPIAMDVFNTHMPRANQISRSLSERVVTAKDLIEAPRGTITEAGVRLNINVGILYLESWLRGQGAAAIYHLMEDAATAEISRTQLWQWIHNGGATTSGQTITYAWVKSLIPQELANIEAYVGKDRYQSGRFAEATEVFDYLIREPKCSEFLTLQAYDLID